LLTAPKHLVLPAVTVTASVAGAPNADGTVDIVVKSTGGAALYVVLTTLAQGRFTENGFMVAGPAGTMRFFRQKLILEECH
jgi:hypothetical protein